MNNSVANKTSLCCAVEQTFTVFYCCCSGAHKLEAAERQRQPIVTSKVMQHTYLSRYVPSYMLTCIFKKPCIYFLQSGTCMRSAALVCVCMFAQSHMHLGAYK